MSKFVAVVALALLVASCGRPGGGAQHAGSGAACALIAQPEALFGTGVQSSAAGDVGAGSCRWESTDGRRGGDVILYDAASLGNVAPHDFVAQTAQRWGAA
ncbi:MAG TPA: hypothetical protein VG943_06020, partial [Caulobacterales bacterium]|nr:hypothetical protein [Caulobacterales bacterium]